MAGNSGCVGTKYFGCIRFTGLFININPLLSKHRERGWKEHLKTKIWVKLKKIWRKERRDKIIFLSCFLASGRNRLMEVNKRMWLINDRLKHTKCSHLYCHGTLGRLTNAPSSLKIAEEPMQSDGTIFLLQRRRRNVSEVRSFLWNFQPIREEYSQPSPGSLLFRRD